MLRGIKTAVNSISVVLVLVVFISIVVAVHTITSNGGTSVYVKEDLGFVYNITVNNTNIGQDANITQVNITLPNSFTLIRNSNGSDAFANAGFVNTSRLLSWNNVTNFLINGSLDISGVLNYFWFNATASTPGTYNITVETVNGTKVSNFNITVVVNDTTAPSEVEFNSPTPNSGANLSRTDLPVNVTVVDVVSLGTIRIYLYNASTFINNTNYTTGSGTLFNFTGLTNGIYYINATANDTSGNENLTGTGMRNVITLDNTAPSITFSCSPSSVSINAVVTCSCSSTDNVDSNPTETWTVKPSTGVSGDYTTTCTSVDYTGNSANTSVSYTVVNTGGTGSSSSSGGGSTSNIVTYVYDNKELIQDQPVTKELEANSRIKVKINGTTHYASVKSIGSGNVNMEISSDIQSSTIKVGEIKKFDVTKDGYYDLSVKLNSITGLKASITLTGIYEKIVPISEVISDTSSPVVDDKTTNDVNLGELPASGSIIEKINFVYLGIAVIVIIVLLIVMKYFSGKRTPPHLHHHLR